VARVWIVGLYTSAYRYQDPSELLVNKLRAYTEADVCCTLGFLECLATATGLSGVESNAMDKDNSFGQQEYFFR